MIVNLHTHTPRCRHASGSEQEYIEAALESGLEVLGFSDHTPYWFPGDYYSHMRMYPEELKNYAQTVLALRDEYAGRLEIPLGVEVEYYPTLLPTLLPRLRDAGIEYMILGQHWNGDEMGQEYNGQPSESEKKLEQYCNQIIDAMHTGLFTYIAHPELLYFVGEDKIFKKHMGRICKEAKACDIPLEINLLGLRQNRHYPHPLFWELAAQEGCSVVLGCDAHAPQDLLDKATEDKAMEIAQLPGLTLVERPALIHI